MTRIIGSANLKTAPIALVTTHQILKARARDQFILVVFTSLVTRSVDCSLTELRGGAGLPHTTVEVFGVGYALASEDAHTVSHLQVCL